MDLATRRLEQQWLLEPCARPEDVVASLLAVQSQDFLGAKWAVAQRTLGGDDAAVQQAYDDGRLLRTHVLRPTWHFVTPANLRWLLQLTAPRVHAGNAYYYRQHGLDATAAKRSNARITKALSGGKHLTRTELAAAIGARGDVPNGNRLAYFLMRAELDGLICSGPLRGKQHTYALLEERAAGASALPRDEALALLAHAYVTGHGPAQVQDLAWWSGLTLADAKRAFEANDRLERTVIDDATYWHAPASSRPPRKTPIVHLLPNYDELLIAFQDRSAMIDPHVTPKADVLSAHFVTVNGRIVGGWRRTLSRRHVAVHARLLRQLSASERRGLDAAAARYAQSLGLALRLEVEQVQPTARRAGMR